MEEIWKTIDGYPNYQVSTRGRVKSLSYNRTGKERTLTPCVDRKGYLFVCLGGKCLRIHRLVAKAFIPKSHGKDLINHKDENKRNNSVENLEWCDAKYNLSYNGIRSKVVDAHKRNVAQYKDGIIIHVFSSISEAAEFYNVSVSAISNCLRGISKTCKGFTWKYEFKRIKLEQQQLTLF